MPNPAPRPRPCKAAGEAGFTLVEVMAALFVFATAAAGLLHINAENARTTRLVETRALANLVAENAMTDTFIEPGMLGAGALTSEVRLAGRTFEVRRRVVETPNANIVQVQVEVRQAGSRAGVGEAAPVDARLVAFRRAGL